MDASSRRSKGAMLAWCGNSRGWWRCSCWRWGLLPGIQAAAKPSLLQLNPPCCGVELVWKCRFSLAKSRGFREPCCSGRSKKSGRCLKPQAVGLGGQAHAGWVALNVHGVHFKWRCAWAAGGSGKGTRHRIGNMLGCIRERFFLVPLKK